MIMPTISGWVAIAGLFANALGVILLFYFGMPFRTRTGGNVISFTTTNFDSETIIREDHSDRLGRVGLCLIIAGTIAQMVSFAIG
jgi:hypothetical protein